MTRREYKPGIPTTLAAAINSSATTITIDAYTNWPTGADGNFWVTIDGGTAQEERVLCSAHSSGSVTVATRGVDGTTASSHAKGATIWPSWSATDADEANAHINSTGYSPYSKAVHGLGSTDGVVVGTTKEQTLTLKTLASPTITGTITGAVVTSANIVDGTITGTDIASGTITSTNILDGTIVNADINASAAIAASKLSGVVTPTSTDTLTNKTLTSPKINEDVIVTATATQLNYVAGVTSAIQTQLDTKATTSALTSHEADTTSIHGITDTSKLARFGSAAAGRTIFVQTSTPTALATGDLWIDY
jgi:hypothetical protein